MESVEKMNNQDRLILDKEQLNDLVNSCQKEIRRLKEENQRLNNVLNELKWKPIEEYKKSKYDWVLVKYFFDMQQLDKLNELKESDK